MQYRQGDVLLVETTEIPAGTPSQDRVLAHGEVTGHAHAIEGEVEIIRRDDPSTAEVVDAWLRMRSGGTLTHQEHGAISLPPGSYEVRRQREYTPGAIRRVAD